MVNLLLPGRSKSKGRRIFGSSLTCTTHNFNMEQVKRLIKFKKIYNLTDETTHFGFVLSPFYISICMFWEMLHNKVGIV